MSKKSCKIDRVRVANIIAIVDSVECLEWVHSYYGGVSQLEYEVFEVAAIIGHEPVSNQDLSSDDLIEEQVKLIQIADELAKDLAA